jgi:hypothetical protein
MRDIGRSLRRADDDAFMGGKEEASGDWLVFPVDGRGNLDRAVDAVHELVSRCEVEQDHPPVVARHAFPSEDTIGEAVERQVVAELERR